MTTRKRSTPLAPVNRPTRSKRRANETAPKVRELPASPSIEEQERYRTQMRSAFIWAHTIGDRDKTFVLTRPGITVQIQIDAKALAGAAFDAIDPADRDRINWQAEYTEGDPVGIVRQTPAEIAAGVRVNVTGAHVAACIDAALTLAIESVAAIADWAARKPTRPDTKSILARFQRGAAERLKILRSDAKRGRGHKPLGKDDAFDILAYGVLKSQNLTAYRIGKIMLGLGHTQKTDDPSAVTKRIEAAAARYTEDQAALEAAAGKTVEEIRKFLERVCAVA
jgi:hypothetical protein